MAAARKSRLTNVEVEAVSRALADPNRFAILQQIAAKSCVACSCLREHQSLSPATISHHIKELQEAQLIDVVREGRTAVMSLRRDVWNGYLEQLGRL